MNRGSQSLAKFVARIAGSPGAAGFVAIDARLHLEDRGGLRDVVRVGAFVTDDAPDFRARMRCVAEKNEIRETMIHHLKRNLVFGELGQQPDSRRG